MSAWSWVLLVEAVVLLIAIGTRLSDWFTNMSCGNCPACRSLNEAFELGDSK